MKAPRNLFPCGRSVLSGHEFSGKFFPNEDARTGDKDMGLCVTRCGVEGSKKDVDG